MQPQYSPHFIIRGQEPCEARNGPAKRRRSHQFILNSIQVIDVTIMVRLGPTFSPGPEPCRDQLKTAGTGPGPGPTFPKY